MKTKHELISYQDIVKAINGDVHAIKKILKHYEKYIIKLSQKTLFDEYGNPYIGYEDETKSLLEIKLITAIFKFRIDY